MMSQGLGKPKVHVDFVDTQPISPAADLLPGPRTEVDLPNLISRLMEGEDPEALRGEYGSEPVEEAISVLENRI